MLAPVTTTAAAGRDADVPVVLGELRAVARAGIPTAPTALDRAAARATQAFAGLAP